MTTKTVREIIRNINVGSPEDGDLSLGHRIGDEGIDRVVLALRQLLLESLPKEFNSHHRSNEGYNRNYITGYNQSLTDMKQAIEKLCGGDKRRENGKKD